MDSLICTGYRGTVKGRSALAAALFGLVPWFGVVTQSVPRPAARAEVFAGSELETYFRNLQVAGVIGLYPWSARRLTAAEVDGLLPADSGHPWAARYDWRPAPGRGLSTAFARPEVVSRLNTGFPYGYNDGPVWAGRGLTLTVQGGGTARYGPLAGSFVPLVSWASNDRFRLQPNGQTGAMVYADGRYPGAIDRPQRFGPGPYTVLSWGQTTLEVARWGVVTGVSSANEFWGPVSEFPVILGNNAGGFPHVFVGTAAPIDLWIARVHLRSVFGRLTQTAYTRQAGDSAIRAATGAVLVISPRWPDGIELGAVRFIHRLWVQRKSVPAELWSPWQFSTRNDSLENQLASVFFRWVVPRAGVEVYAEYGTEDIRYDLREAIVEPDHIAGYTIGLRHVTERPRDRLRVIRAEVQNLQRGTLVQSRSQGPFYTHGSLAQGHTYQGQVLGSAWGVGGAAAKVAVDWYHPRGRWTVAWSRLLRADTGDTVATTSQNPRSIDVMYTLGVEAVFFRGRYDAWAGATAVYEFHRDFRRDAFNLNLTVGARASLP